MDGIQSIVKTFYEIPRWKHARSENTDLPWLGELSKSRGIDHRIQVHTHPKSDALHSHRILHFHHCIFLLFHQQSDSENSSFFQILNCEMSNRRSGGKQNTHKKLFKKMQVCDAGERFKRKIIENWIRFHHKYIRNFIFAFSRSFRTAFVSHYHPCWFKSKAQNCPRINFLSYHICPVCEAYVVFDKRFLTWR
jgi:hypothetical protein